MFTYLLHLEHVESSIIQWQEPVIIIYKFLSSPWCLLFATEIQRLLQFLDIFEPCKK